MSITGPRATDGPLLPVEEPRSPPAAGLPTLLRIGRAAFGVLLIGAPRPALEIVSVRPPSAPAVAFVRLLGARHLAQGAWLGGRGRRAHLAGAGIDGVHAVTALGLAAARRRRRRALLLNALAASLLAAEGLRAGAASR